MVHPLVSIALCTYNGEKYLAEQLDSLVGQDYPNLEIIVVDDRSSDSTLIMLEDYAARYPFIKVFQNEQNLGYIKNFEKAITLCNGEYIALADQDDRWDLKKISMMVEQLNGHQLIYHDSAFIDQSGKPLHKKMSDLLHMYAGNDFKPFVFFNCVSGHACLFKKALTAYALPFPKNLFHDRWLAYVATNVGSIGYIDKCLVNYRQHESSDTNILKLERKETKKELHGVPKIKKTLDELEVLLNFGHNADPGFLQKLYRLYAKRLTSFLCPRLMFFLFAHFGSLLYLSKKSTLSKLNFVFKHLWGSKLKGN
ncbi:MAG: glycosyltransferase family 2 protein [Pedobacter sp.]|nr:glycosyltransferase family 2 protein [Pedobacter sp.]MDQ8052714.1 glycosyltransferase family 2 protein [Pedobacter sp.]